MSDLMEKEVYNAAVNGDKNIFRNKNHQHLLKKTNQNNNIIHIAAQHQQLDFIKAALNSFPSTPTCASLICDQNRHGNTPFHIASQVRYEPLVVQLYEYYSTKCKDDTSGSDRVLPWRMVNLDGNTPAHVALIYGNATVAMYLIDKDDYVARVLNRSKETLLHLAIQYHNFDNESQMPETQAISSSKKVYQPGEELQPIIELLLKRESSVACWTDRDGLTPLHRATSLHPVHCIPVIKAILASCPEAAEVQAKRTHHTVLHLLTNKQVTIYEQGLELLQIPQVYALRNIKDHKGDTPLHLAARNKDTIMVRVLLSSSPHLDMKNKRGVSAGSLVRQLEKTRITEAPVQHKRKLTKEEYEAALQGNVAFLNEQLVSLGINFLASHTSTGGNILHVLLKYIFNDGAENSGEAEEFVGKAIQMLPSLISQQDRNGNTLVHLIADKNIFLSQILNIICKYFQKGEEDGIHLPQPWRLKNAKGDMPFHVAIRAGNYVVSLQLLEMDEEVADYVINRNQNPLHLISHHHEEVNNNRLRRLMNALVNVNAELPYMQDEDGLTPLLVAVQGRRSRVIKLLIEGFPECKKIADFKGRIFWHLFVSQPAEQKPLSDVFSDINFELTDHDRRLMKSKDNDGNTPLHLAIKNRHFDFAQFFLDNWTTIFKTRELNYICVLPIENKEGISCYNLIGSAEHLPHEFERNLFYNGNLLSGHRSKYGIPTNKIEAYTNTIGVIAALLATITFTGAFAVPGGLDSSNGTPFFLRKAMFQVFLVADVMAMCSSMMVLFCLLWIMTTVNKAKSISLLDISVFLLQTSLHTTIVAFMTGLYVTTNSIAPAIAISTCVACTLLIILMHKTLVMLTVVPFLESLITLGQNVGRLLSSLWSSIKSKCCGSTHNTEVDEM